MTVRELLARIDAAELAEWQAYAALEPFGPLREDLRAGTTAALMATAWGRKRYEPMDFFRELDPTGGKPIEVDDPRERAQVIASQIFGLTRKA